MSSNEQIVSEDYQNLFRVNKGMWIFIFIDFLLFAGLLAYHFLSGGDFQNEFAFGKSQLLFSFGVLNTIVLFTSGLTIGLSKVAVFNKNDFLSTIFIFITFIFAMLFFANRAIDCSYLFDKGFLLGTETFISSSKGVALFFTTYFIINFIFTLHLLIGIILLIMLLIDSMKDLEPKDKFAKLNFTVIYWNYLTIIWVFIFPILFLI
ncbi:MAG: cytochrome c oxidase subunit 3 [Melioribacteraceae bacterium]|nr:cytochrome c oxidase subunit 3 [Melioribacteraceae bacterium]